MEDVLLSNHFGPAGICGSIGWSQYFKDSDIGPKFKHQKIKLFRKLSRLIPYSVFSKDIKGFTKIKYKIFRSRVPHLDINPSKWLKQVILQTEAIKSSGLYCKNGICKCDSQNLRLYYTEGNDDQFKYYKCLNCKLVNYDMSAGFDQEKHTKYFIDPRDNKHKTNTLQEQTYNFIKRYIAKPGKLLDVGCCNGRLLLIARKDGWEVGGIELFSFLADSIKKTTGIDVKVCNFL